MNNATAEMMSVDISNAIGNGIYVEGSHISPKNIVSTVPNGGFGINLDRQAQADLKNDTSSTITGAAGDVRIGANGAATWTDIVNNTVPAGRSDYTDNGAVFASISN